MTISSITSAAATNAAATRQTLGQTDFIRLMTTQMTMQDPTDPVDNKEMIAQMAQFSSLSGIENVNTALQGISVQLDAILAAQTLTQSATTPVT